MIDSLYPRTKNDLINAIQRMKIERIEIIDGYSPEQEQELMLLAKGMSQGVDDLTIIMARS